jgi:hypothetical protein
MIGSILVIFISIDITMGSLLLLSISNIYDQDYLNLTALDGTVKCSFCHTIFASSPQYRLEDQVPFSNLLTLNNADVTGVGVNPKENMLYILGVEQDDEMIDRNVVFVVDTQEKKIANKIIIEDRNLNLDNILFDGKNNRLYGTGSKLIENDEKLMRTNFIFEINLFDGKNKISFNNITTRIFPIESEDYDDTDIADIDIDIKSSNIYLILNNNSIIGQNISGKQDQVDTNPYKSKDNQQVYVITYGNEIINNPNKKLNYVLFNSIKSFDKDVVLVSNESTGRVVENYTLPSLNSRNLLIDSNKGKLYILGDYFAYNDDIKGLSKQAEMINIIDTNNNNVTHFSLGNFTIKDFIFSPYDDVLYAITKGDMNSLQQKSNANHLLEINAKTGLIRDIASIPLELNYVVINDISQTLFIIGEDSQDQNKILSINIHK